MLLTKPCEVCGREDGSHDRRFHEMHDKIDGLQRRLKRLERCTCQYMGNGFVASNGRCPKHNPVK